MPPPPPAALAAGILALLLLAASLPPWPPWLAAARAEGYLPLTAVAAAAAPLDVAVHQSAGDRLAYVLPVTPADPQVQTPGPPAAATAPAGATLFLHQPTYLRDGAWVPLAELPVDAVEQLFHALLSDYLERQLADPASALGTRLAQRAEVLFATLPPAQRQAAYVTAAADFAAHVLSLANEIERLFRRRGDRLCSRLHQPRTLFALWPRAFHEVSFTGSYFQPGALDPAGGPPQPGRWVDTGIALAPADRQLIGDAVLEGRWRGEVDADLASRYCSPAMLE